MPATTDDTHPEASANAQPLTRADVIALLNTQTRLARKNDQPAGEDPRRRTLLRYPRLTAHLICQSLGYFTPGCAANALRHYKNAEPFWCEWYLAQAGNQLSAAPVVEAGRNTLHAAIRQRHAHQGYMAEYCQARVAILQELAGHGHPLASWF